MKFVQPCEGHVSRLLHGRSVSLERRQFFNITTIIIIILEDVSKGEDVHDSWKSVQSHGKPINLDQIGVYEIVLMDVLQISFTQCGSPARARALSQLPSVLFTQPITCGAF